MVSWPGSGAEGRFGAQPDARPSFKQRSRPRVHILPRRPRRAVCPLPSAVHNTRIRTLYATASQSRDRSCAFERNHPLRTPVLRRLPLRSAGWAAPAEAQGRGRVHRMSIPVRRHGRLRSHSRPGRYLRGWGSCATGLARAASPGPFQMELKGDRDQEMTITEKGAWHRCAIADTILSIGEAKASASVYKQTLMDERCSTFACHLI